MLFALYIYLIKMKLVTIESLLKQAKNQTFWTKTHALWFTGHEYQAVFIADFLAMLDRLSVFDKSIVSIPLDSWSYSQLVAQLEQSFLGESCYYWLGDISAKSDKKAKRIQSYLESYQGPHTIIGYVSSAALEKMKLPGLSVSLDTRVTPSLCIALLRSFNYERLAQKPVLIKQLCTMLPTMSLDHSCILGRHLSVMSNASADDYTNYIHMLIKPTASLQKLAGYFFTKQGSSFYRAWAQLEKNYSPMFWLAFWSSQIWQAAAVIVYLKQKNYSVAKQVGYRLPRNVTQQGLQSLSRDELLHAHDFLYQADYALKTGSSFCVLDLFFTRYFSGDFFSDSLH